MSKHRTDTCLPPLHSLGIDWDDCHALRRIAMTLHRWHELECGDSDGRVLVRGKKNGKTFEYSDDGAPFIEGHPPSGTMSVWYSRIPDRETGARKRLAKIMAKYPNLVAYVQTDPRGASLYILQSSDIPAGAELDSCYSRGVAVYK